MMKKLSIGFAFSVIFVGCTVLAKSPKRVICLKSKASCWKHLTTQQRLNSLFRPIRLSRKNERQVLNIMRETRKYWMDRHGFIRLTPNVRMNPSIDNENPVLFTATYYYLLWRLGILNQARQKQLLPHIKKMLQLLRLEPGLFNRFPHLSSKKKGHPRHFSRDEQIGLGTLDCIFSGRLGLFRELYAYGQKTRFRYENRTWVSKGMHRKIKWSQRFVGMRQYNFRGYIKLGVGYSMSWLERTWTIAALYNPRYNDKQQTSGKILAYLRFQVLHRDPALHSTIFAFHTQMKRLYGKYPLEHIFKIYYRHPKHPIHRLVRLLR